MKLTNTRKLPPLINIESFIKVVELGSISAAASEIFLTQSAISRHIIDFEKFVGRKLLIRTSAGIVITEEARHLAVKLSFLLSDLNSIFFGGHNGIFFETVRISAPPIFCINFFAKNINEIQTKLCGDVEILSRNGTPDLYLENIDVAVISSRAQPMDYPGDLLFSPDFYPYISCDLSAQDEVLTLEDFQKFNLINQLLIKDAWNIYFREIGIDLSPRPRATFSIIDSALAAVLNSQGVAFIPEFVAKEYEQVGKIKKFHDKPFSSIKTNFFLIYKKEISTDTRFLNFRKWLLNINFK